MTGNNNCWIIQTKDLGTARFFPFFNDTTLVESFCWEIISVSAGGKLSDFLFVGLSRSLEQSLRTMNSPIRTRKRCQTSLWAKCRTQEGTRRQLLEYLQGVILPKPTGHRKNQHESKSIAKPTNSRRSSFRRWCCLPFVSDYSSVRHLTYSFRELTGMVPTE